VLLECSELRGNASGRASRIDEEGEDEDDGHDSFYSGGRVKMEP
jgi:hypothetical protein